MERGRKVLLVSFIYQFWPIISTITPRNWIYWPLSYKYLLSKTPCLSKAIGRWRLLTSWNVTKGVRQFWCMSLEKELRTKCVWQFPSHYSIKWLGVTILERRRFYFGFWFWKFQSEFRWAPCSRLWWICWMSKSIRWFKIKRLCIHDSGVPLNWNIASKREREAQKAKDKPHV